jgi:putative transposase
LIGSPLQIEIAVAVRRDAMVRKEAFYTVLGVRPDRTREVLSVVNAPTESSTGWQQIVQQLYQRGRNKSLNRLNGLR